MPLRFIASAIGIALGSLMVSPASAVIIDPPGNFGGTLNFDDSTEQFQFSIAAPSIVKIATISYSGGFEAPNPAIFDPGGGFDPVLSLFDGSGAFIADNDDVDFPFDLDSTIERTLGAGTYTVVVSQFDNFFAGGVGDDISLGFTILGISPGVDPRFFTNEFNCSNGKFCDVFADNRSAAFNVNVTARPVPEPSALALLGIGLVGIGMAARRRKTT